jgi:hypothetical protein
MKTAWQSMRAVRWLLWVSFFAYCLHYMLYSASHLDHFGHLFLSTEIAMYGLSLAAVIAGLLELMLRDKAGIVKSPARGPEGLAR